MKKPGNEEGTLFLLRGKIGKGLDYPILVLRCQEALQEFALMRVTDRVGKAAVANRNRRRRDFSEEDSICVIGLIDRETFIRTVTVVLFGFRNKASA